ncbi:glycosyl hydrolase [soil metagenome]
MNPFRIFAAMGDAVARIDTPDGHTFDVSYAMEGMKVQSVAVDPHDPDRVVAGTDDDGVFLTTDGGENWRFIGEEIQHRRTPSVAISPAHRENGTSVIYVGTEPSRLYRSEDDGKTWRDFPELPALPSSTTWSFPPRPWTHHTRWITPHATKPEILYVGIELGGVMRSTDAGETWEDRKPGAYTDSHAIRVHPTGTERVYEAAGQGVALSLDEGESWTPVDEGMDRHYSWGIAVDPVDPALWYVSASHSARYAHARNGNAQAHLYRKRGDAPFELLNTDLDNPLPYMPYSLLTLRDRPGVLLAGMQHGEILLSEDAGDRWRRLDLKLPGLLQLDEAVTA